VEKIVVSDAGGGGERRIEFALADRLDHFVLERERNGRQTLLTQGDARERPHHRADRCPFLRSAKSATPLKPGRNPMATPLTW